LQIKTIEKRNNLTKEISKKDNLPGMMTFNCMKLAIFTSCILFSSVLAATPKTIDVLINKESFELLLLLLVLKKNEIFVEF